MRNKIYNHPDLPYIIKQIKKGTPYTEIERNVNKRAKGEPLTRHTISRFARTYDKQIMNKTAPIIEQINELKKLKLEPTFVEGESYLEQEILPASEALEKLFENALAYAPTVLEELKKKERSIKDFKTFVDALQSIQALRNDLHLKSPQALVEGNEYEKYMLEVSYTEVSEHE